jgi:hypothetical protein
MLGLDHSSRDGVIISRSKLANMKDYIITNRKKIDTIFGIPINKFADKKYTPKKDMEYLNKIYNEWGGCQISAVSNNKHASIEFITASPYKKGLPLPYKITWNVKKESKCLININAMVVVDDTPIIVAERLDTVIMDVIPEAILIPSKYKEYIKDDDEEIDVETIMINDNTYYTNNTQNGNLFEISENDSVGNSIGNIINSVPYFF